jgi:hypothetical protein
VWEFLSWRCPRLQQGGKYQTRKRNKQFLKFSKFLLIKYGFALMKGCLMRIRIDSKTFVEFDLFFDGRSHLLTIIRLKFKRLSKGFPKEWVPINPIIYVPISFKNIMGLIEFFRFAGEIILTKRKPGQ